MAMIETSQNFLKESVQELKKVTRPGRKEILGSSAVVLVVTAFFMIVTLLEDQLIGYMVGWLFKN